MLAPAPVPKLELGCYIDGQGLVLPLDHDPVGMALALGDAVAHPGSALHLAPVRAQVDKAVGWNRVIDCGQNMDSSARIHILSRPAGAFQVLAASLVECQIGNRHFQTG